MVAAHVMSVCRVVGIDFHWPREPTARLANTQLTKILIVLTTDLFIVRMI